MKRSWFRQRGKRERTEKRERRERERGKRGEVEVETIVVRRKLKNIGIMN